MKMIEPDRPTVSSVQITIIGILYDLLVSSAPHAMHSPSTSSKRRRPLLVHRIKTAKHVPPSLCNVYLFIDLFEAIFK